MSDTLTISVGGKKYSGWTAATIRRAVVTLTGDFEISMTDTHDGGAFYFAVGKLCVLRINDTRVMTGYVDAVDVNITGQNHTVKIRGRDKTADLVDCSAMQKATPDVVSADVPTGIPFGNQFFNITIGQLFKSVCDPFGIKVVDNSGGTPAFDVFQVSEGEKVFDMLDRACKMNGLIMVSDPLGRLVITRGGDGGTAPGVTLGENVWEASGGYDMSGRFSYYRVVQESVLEQLDETEQNATLMAQFGDAGVGRFRPLLIYQEPGIGSLPVDVRAKMEALTRAAKGAQFEVTVIGWTNPSGIWQPNQFLPAKLLPLYLDAQMLVAEVTYTMDKERGPRTKLKLIRPDAFDNRVLTKIVQPKGGIGVLRTLAPGPESSPLLVPFAPSDATDTPGAQG